MEYWEMERYTAPVTFMEEGDNYAVCFSAQGMMVLKNGQMTLIQDLPAQTRQGIIGAIESRKEWVDNALLRLGNWKDALEERVDRLESIIDEVDSGDEFSYFEDTLFEERETMTDDMETERDEAQEKVDELDDQIGRLEYFSRCLEAGVNWFRMA